MDSLMNDDGNDLLLLLLLKEREITRTRNDLNNDALVTPEQSPWAQLWKNGDDMSFTNAIGIPRQAFIKLHRHFKQFYCRSRSEMKKGGRPTKVSSEQALGLLLQFYASTSELKLVAQLHGCRKNTASRIIYKAEIALENALKQCRDAQILWPTKETQGVWARIIEEKYPAIENRFGKIILIFSIV